jgi:hypothetical protein
MNEYTQKANEFLAKTNTTFSYDLVGTYYGFPNHENDTNPRNHFKVTLENPKGKLELDFYGSYQDWINGNEEITSYDVLASMGYEPQRNVWEFAQEFGYEITNQKQFQNAKRILKEMKRQYKALVKMFSQDELLELVEIQ